MTIETELYLFAKEAVDYDAVVRYDVIDLKMVCTVQPMGF